MRTPTHPVVLPDELPCPVEAAARIIGRKWTLQIVHRLLNAHSKRFCELQEQLGGVNPSTLSSRLKMLEDEGLVKREAGQFDSAPCRVQSDTKRQRVGAGRCRNRRLESTLGLL